MNWEKRGPEDTEAFKAFSKAFTKQFNSHYGKDADSLQAWQRICRELNIFPVPDNLVKAKEVGFCSLKAKGCTNLSHNRTASGCMEYTHQPSGSYRRLGRPLAYS